MRKIFLVPVFVFSLAYMVTAQPVDNDLPQITGCIALINAKVVAAPGKAPVVSDIIMRDGLITQLGPNLKIPADAYRIQADSFFVYPAFIDALSYTGIKEAEEDSGSRQQGPGNRDSQRPGVDSEGNPPLEEAGITPFNNVRAMFDPKAKSISDWRAQGFAVAHIVPKGKMLPGKGSVVVLSGKDADEVLWKEDVSMYAQWNGAGGSYPSTVIGVMAKWRELYYNATQEVAHQAAYNNAALVSRPKYNQAHEALIPVVKKEMPVFFRAPGMKDISRALALQEDLGMRMVIADAKEAWYLEDQFKSGNIPLVLSIDLPEDKSDSKKVEGAKEAKGAKEAEIIQPPSGDLGAKEEEGAKEAKEVEGAKEAETATKLDTLQVDPEKEAFEKKRAESLKAHREQAGVLANDGIAFSFGTISGKAGDFSKNMQVMITNGLSEEKALQALTTQPAKLLGIEKYCGTIAPGKMANVIVSTKPVFEKDAAIRYMIVEGNLYEYEIKEKKKPGAKSTGSSSFGLLGGTWSYTIETPDQKREGKFEFTNGNNEIKGTISSEDITTGNNELEDIVIDGNTASFTFDLDMGGQMVTLEFDLKLDGESFEGTVAVGEFGSFPVNGMRTSKPN